MPILHITHVDNLLADLERLDWNAIRSRHWADTPEDPDRKRRKQAEFLALR